MELTDKCNARCVQCERNFIDKDGELKERPELLLTEISIDQYKKIFKNYQKQTYHLTFCGNTGDPLFVKDILEITEYSITNVMSEGYSKLQIYTNGGYRSKEWWSNYGKLLKVNSIRTHFSGIFRFIYTYLNRTLLNYIYIFYLIYNLI